MRTLRYISVVAVTCAFALASCQGSPMREGQFACDGDENCPPGWECGTDGYCYSGTGTDIDTDADSDTESGTDADVPCTTTYGGGPHPDELSGTCSTDPGSCEGGLSDDEEQGTCAEGEVCCIDTDQCVDTLEFTCVAEEDECSGQTPPEGFPMMGCPGATPYCCT